MSITATTAWILDSDQFIVMGQLQKCDTAGAKTTVTSGAVTAQFYDEDTGASVGDEITLSHVSAGRWVGLKPEDIAMTAGKRYRAEVTAIVDGMQWKWNLVLPARRGAKSS